VAGGPGIEPGFNKQQPIPPTCDPEWLDEIEDHFSPLNTGVLFYSWMIVSDLDWSGIGAKTVTEFELNQWPAIH
jgi:hypothetical protein